MKLIPYSPFPPRPLQPPVDQGLFIVADSRPHSDTPHSVELLWTSDQLIAESHTLQNTAFTIDILPCCGWDSNLQSQQASGRRPAPQKVRPLGSASMPCSFIVQLITYLSFPQLEVLDCDLLSKRHPTVISQCFAESCCYEL
jgi:hypothetical protein